MSTENQNGSANGVSTSHIEAQGRDHQASSNQATPPRLLALMRHASSLWFQTILPIFLLLIQIFRASLRAFLAAICWTWQAREGFLTWIFRFLTLLSVGYLLFDRIYETGVTISCPASDPKNPFLFPFAVTNNSHIFAIKDVRWRCTLRFLEFENHIYVANSVRLGEGHESAIGPNANVNISCAGFSAGDRKILSGKIKISIGYKMPLPLGFGFCRTIAASFSWVGKDTAQWIRGNLPGQTDDDFIPGLGRISPSHFPESHSSKADCQIGD
jgi:hypothetical protein